MQIFSLIFKKLRSDTKSKVSQKVLLEEKLWSVSLLL